MQQPSERATQLPAANGAARAHWWSSNRANSIFSAASAIGLELLPVEAVLIVVAAGGNAVISDVALPLWYGIIVLTASYIVGSRLRSIGVARIFVLSIPLILVSWFFLLRFSPSAYGNVSTSPLDLKWLNALFTDLTTGAARLSNDVWLLLLALYLWFRGVRVGSQTPLLDDVLRRFKVGIALIIFVAAVISITQSEVRGQALGALTFILPVEVFCGLVASALTRIASQPLSLVDSERQRPWISSAIGLAAGVVSVALLIGLIFNGGDVSALLQHLGPLGTVLDAAARWLTDGIARLLSVVVGAPIQALKSVAAHATSSPISVPNTCKTQACEQPNNAPPPLILIILSVVFYGFLVMVLILLVVRFIRWLRAMMANRARTGDEDPTEERESLDGGSIFRKQLRDLFRRRRTRSVAPTEIPLDPASIRGLYREVLRTAARAGIPRLSTETPDEYASRATALPSLATNTEATADLSALSEAYDAARYGDDEGSQSFRAAAAERARRLLGLFRARSR